MKSERKNFKIQKKLIRNQKIAKKITKSFNVAKTSKKNAQDIVAKKKHICVPPLMAQGYGKGPGEAQIHHNAPKLVICN